MRRRRPLALLGCSLSCRRCTGRCTGASALFSPQADLAASAFRSIWISPWLLHNDPSKWEEPETFNPDRFYQGRPEAWQFLPFSNGPRNCIGQRFAMQEAKLILAMMMRRFSLGHVKHNLVRETAITQRPKNGIPLRLIPRA